MLLEGRIALVTGAGQGNGEAIARGLAKQGARVVATDLDPATAERTAAAIRASGGEAHAFALDVVDLAACRALAEQVGDTIGDVSILVNNAGVCPRHSLDSA